MAQRHGHALSTDAATLRVFERKVLRKIFDPVRVGDDFRIQSNSELLNGIDIQRIDSRITADNYTFDTVKVFIYLGSTITTKMMSG